METMDVDNADDVQRYVTIDGSSSLVNPDKVSTVSVSLHPLVLINISEHWTRINAQEESNCTSHVFGALLGKQEGRNIEIFNSFELKFDQSDDGPVLDSAFFSAAQDRFKQIFADLDVLGWYNNGSSLTEQDMQIHSTFVDILQTPLFLKFNPLVSSMKNFRNFSFVSFLASFS